MTAAVEATESTEFIPPTYTSGRLIYYHPNRLQNGPGRVNEDMYTVMWDAPPTVSMVLQERYTVSQVTAAEYLQQTIGVHVTRKFDKKIVKGRVVDLVEGVSDSGTMMVYRTLYANGRLENLNANEFQKEKDASSNWRIQDLSNEPVVINPKNGR